MANHVFASFWAREHSEELMLDRFERLLGAVPLSSIRPGFQSLIVRAVSASETPLVEHDLRGIIMAPADIIALAREHRNADSSYEVDAWWDLWQRDATTGQWRREPERIVLICNGAVYDDGASAESGDYLADLGFEHLFTGHAGLLGSHGARSAPSDPVEAEFLAWMTHEEHLHEYYQKTCENIQQLLNWAAAAKRALPVARYQLWSEGEENLEARLDEILAVH
jgi:hypothetical protein